MPRRAVPEGIFRPDHFLHIITLFYDIVRIENKFKVNKDAVY